MVQIDRREQAIEIRRDIIEDDHHEKDGLVKFSSQNWPFPDLVHQPSHVWSPNFATRIESQSYELHLLISGMTSNLHKTEQHLDFKHILAILLQMGVKLRFFVQYIYMDGTKNQHFSPFYI